MSGFRTSIHEGDKVVNNSETANDSAILENLHQQLAISERAFSQPVPPTGSEDHSAGPMERIEPTGVAQTGIEELNRLKDLLSRQREETVRALQSNSQLRIELNATNGELSSLQTKIEKQLVNLSDISSLKDKLKNTETELEVERRSHQIDLRNAASRISKLEHTLANGTGVRKRQRFKIPKSIPEREASESRCRIFFAFIILSLVGITILFTVRTNSFILRSLTIWDVTEEPKPPQARAKKSQAIDSPSTGQIDEMLGKSSEFSSAISNLDRALASFPGRAEDVLKAVHNEKSPDGQTNCDFTWENGQPALLYNAKKSGFSIALNMNNCAAAIDRFRDRAERDRPGIAYGAK